ncbi:MAG: ATP-binding protein [Bacteroidia bacterium]
MIELFEISASLIKQTRLDFKRYLYKKINWNDRLIGIKGARGTGKSTMLLQWLKEQNMPINQAIYFSLDELYFTKNNLVDTVADFYNKGGKVLILDEVHKYPGWSASIKNLYDRYTDLKIIFTGSSIIDISRQQADLSRRVMMYDLVGLSFREYLTFQYNFNFPVLSLEEILFSSEIISDILIENFKPYVYFNEYLEKGYYPFFIEDKIGYHQRLRQLIRTIIEYDMAEMKGFDIRHAKKLLQLLYVVAQQVPFKPNIQNLAQKTGIHRNSIMNYLYFLQEAKMIYLTYHEGISVATLQKPEKIFLENTNLLYALSENKPESGTVREVFFNNQLNALHRVNHSRSNDFLIDKKYTFEIGGKNKKLNKNIEADKTWLVKDEITHPVGNNLPIWVFGFLY